jgi:hypothetical protein
MVVLGSRIYSQRNRLRKIRRRTSSTQKKYYNSLIITAQLPLADGLQIPPAQ